MSSDWHDVELGQFIELKRGYDLPKNDRKNGVIPLISSAGPTDFHSISKVKGPGVVTGRYGTIGKVFYIDEDFWPLNTTLYVVDFKGNDPLFVYYFLQTINYNEYSDKAAVPGVNRNHLHMAKVRVPRDPVYQRKLVAALWSLDQKIELNRQTNQTLEQIAQAMFKSWFVDFEPTRAKLAAKETGATAEEIERAAMCAISGKTARELAQLNTKAQQQLSATAALFPDALAKSELGEIPLDWKYSEIGDEVEVLGGGTPSTANSEFWEGGDHHWSTPKDMSDLTDNILLETERKITDAGLRKISSGLLPINTVLMSSRAPVGYLAIAKIPVAINQGYIAMKCNNILTPEYVIQWAQIAMDEIQQRASGTTFAEISKKNFRAIKVLVPNSALIQAYSLVVSNLYENITSLLKESKGLATSRDALLPELLSGKLKVNNVN